MDIATLKRGDGIIVRVGTKGTQYAIVACHSKNGGPIRACKWLARGKRWTKRVSVYPVEILRRATIGEYKTDPLPVDY
jgi:hypothetical protein